MKRKIYLSPSVEVVRVNIEKGFATTGGAQVNDYAEEGAAGMLQEGNSYEF